ncbi:hypothetical protein J2X66_001970 [Pseudomonas sp. 3296]|uniref:hypothetical protein n=1 Tax=Pseudomonas sp. 3296 TaxID=2817753 RepID=UPI00285EDFFC|nr:hypothetical protein [Pseudomonas sp. 3296]MDR6915105.1 hypothetical protein [Pseudomonas sp. 3296]
MPNNSAIDTSVLITILGLMAAVWAVVPASNRLRFRLSMSWFDWGVAIGAFLLIHYLVFEQFLRSIGLYYSFGPWKWGLDKGSAVYLLLLGLGLYILLRARTPKLATGKLGTFEELVNTFLLTKRYDELFTLIEPHLFKLFKLAKHRSLLVRLIKKIRPAPFKLTLEIENGNPIFRSVNEGLIQATFRSAITKLESKLAARGCLADRARDVLKSVLNQPKFVAYLSVSHPHFCLRILAIPEVIREDFTDLFVAALIADNNSLLYSELKNNQNLNGRHRLALPTSNRIVYFLFNDITTAERLALYKPIGESVCRCIDEDLKLIDAYNLSLGYYDQSGKYRCPVYAAVKLFEIMIHEGIHQGMQDHLWLFYFTHFTDKILKQLRDQQTDDLNHEWPTPFHFLICEIVTITSNWVDDCIEVKEALISDQVSKAEGFDSQYISKQAAEALGTIIQSILMSPKIDDRFKGYVLEIILEKFRRFQSRKDADTVAHAFINSMIFGNGYLKEGYHQELRRIYKNLDHALRHDVESFDLALNAA